MSSDSYITESCIIRDHKIHITLAPKAQEPRYQTESAVGADLSCLNEVCLMPNVPTLVDTGVSVQLDLGTVGLVFLRSSLGMQGVILCNGVGVIDPDYRGTLKLSLLNTTQTQLDFRASTRLGQLLITPVLKPTFRVVTELGYTARGSGGFGSTGTV